MTNDEWKFINSFAPWLSGIGSLAAVTVSLWLTLRRKTKIVGEIGIYNFGSWDEDSEEVSTIAVKFVNKSEWPVIIKGFGWTGGFFKKTSYIQLLSPKETSFDHFSVDSWEEVTKIVGAGDDAQRLIEQLRTKKIKNLKFYVHSTRGRFRLKIDPYLKKSIKSKSVEF